MNRIFTFVLYFIIKGALYSQNTVGLISYDPNRAFDGYSLLYPHNQPNTYLINNCGEIVHTWPDSTIWRPGNTAYITKEGKLVKTKRNRTVASDPIWVGGGGGIVEIRDWNNNLEWSYEINDTLRRLHHDIKVLNNGNILMLVWDKKSAPQLVSAGRDTSQFRYESLLSEQIIEINPKTNQIVWQWDLWDHIIQDKSTSKPNFGVVSNLPGRVDINYKAEEDGSWFHFNAIDYNHDLNQILVSVPTYNEIWIIDHTTTTAQAKTNIGGLSGVGGDLMYRWGNPATYKKGGANNQKLFYQHGAHWIGSFIPPTHPNYGKISVFNNRVGVDHSEINFFTAPWDMYEWKYTKNLGVWGPNGFNFTAKHPDSLQLFSNILSNAELLPNNNLLVLSGRTGYIFEMTPDKKIVWEYVVPLKNGLAANQGTSLAINDNTTFRVNKYPKSYQAFIGKNLSPKGYIESMPNVDFCSKLVSTKDILPGHIKVYPNPSTEYLIVESDRLQKVTVISIDGRPLIHWELQYGKNQLAVNDLPPGVYFITDGTSVLKAFNVIK